ncbi:ABATE domain-containing protein [Paenibacillus sp. OK003]|uniref:CGNR zinc finger domain-containing protein n=1 Tax=Paenibacillus sp. OK003 TaxID=1884380 RepID=UPI0008C26EDA|nr:ABATE domain-containing protein [Paenibacillus sp. OK003]SEK64723.1 Conserved protein containing a Zn-ribbon-like motif, possibly RNA-binding [Paenibacillus sp. OK003]
MDRLWTDFVNSDYHDWRGRDRSEDKLGKTEWQQGFIKQWQLNASVPASPEEEGALRSFRNELQALATRLSEGNPLSSKDQEWLNAKMEEGQVIRRLNAGDEGLKLSLIPVGTQWQQVMAEVAADFAITVVEGDGRRIRICDNADCRWIFYDDTRSRTQKYCDDNRKILQRKYANPEIACFQQLLYNIYVLKIIQLVVQSIQSEINTRDSSVYLTKKTMIGDVSYGDKLSTEKWLCIIYGFVGGSV